MTGAGGARGRDHARKRRSMWAFICVVVLNGANCILLHAAEAPSVKQLPNLFSAGVLDIMIMDILRLLLVVLVGVWGYRAWLAVQTQVDQDAALGGRNVPLLGLDSSSASGANENSEPLPESSLFTNESLEEERQRIERSRLGEQRRDYAIWVSFAVCSLCAVYSGVKCVTFGENNAFQKSESFTTALIGLEVFLCHAEFYMAKKCLTVFTSPEGLSFPWLHPHTLFFVPKADARMCQTCRSKIRHTNHGASAYYCPLCERHYYCIACLKRQLRQRQSEEASGSLEDVGREQKEKNATLAYLRRVLPLVRPFLHIVAFSLVMVGVNQAFRIAQPHWQGTLLDAISKGDARSFERAVLMYLLINIGNGLFSSIQTSSVLLVMRRLAFRTRLMVFQHILRQDIAYFDANLAGQITSRLTNDANQMTDPVSIIMNNLVANVILLVGGLYMCFQTSWKLSILAMTAIAPITYMVRTYSEWAGKIARKIMDEMSEANGCATQAIQNMRTVRYFGAEKFELDRYETNLSNVYKLQMKDNLTRIANNTFTSYLDLGVGVFVLWYGGSVIIRKDDGHFSLGQLITFQLYWNMMKNAFNGLNDLLSSLLRATSASQRILDLLDLQPTIETEEGQATHTFKPGKMGITYDDKGVVKNISTDEARAIGISLGDQIVKVDSQKYSQDAVVKAEESGTAYEVTFKVKSVCLDEAQVDGTIAIENVTFHYTQKRREKPVLSNVDLVIPGGQVVALVGKSGSGKSTIGSLLLRLYDPTDGKITLDGVDFRRFQPRSLRAQFGVVAQETQLFAGTIEDNVAYAMLRGYSQDELVEAAQKANAFEFIEKCEDRFQTLVGDRGALLSGGQKQRLSIARMFLRQPRLLLLDEATSALDAENEKIVQDALDALCQSGLCRTVIVIAHRLSTVRNANLIAVLEDGELKEKGSHDKLLENSDGIYSQLIHRQLHGQPEEGQKKEKPTRPKAKKASSV